MSGTPILDLEKDPPAPRSRRVGTAIGLLIGAAIGIAAEHSGLMPGVSGLWWIPALYFAIAIHELGHLIVGKLVGMAPGGLAIGGFVMVKSGDHWNVRFDYRRIFGGGMAKPLPVNGEFRIGRYAWMVAGGPVASLLLTAAFGIAYALRGDGGEWIGCFLLVSGFVTVISLLPFSAGVNRTDGARLWLLLTQPERSRAWMAVVMVQAEDARGVRPREWDGDLVARMLAGSPSDPEQPWRQLLAFYRCMDQGDDETALEHLEKALAASGHCGIVVRQALFLTAAEVCAEPWGDAARARVWRERAVKLRKPEFTCCTDAAIATCEGRYEEALREIAKARAYLAKRRLASGLARFGRERLDEMEKAVSGPSAQNLREEVQSSGVL
jgi:hypothetical protein